MVVLLVAMNQQSEIASHLFLGQIRRVQTIAHIDDRLDKWTGVPPQCLILVPIWIHCEREKESRRPSLSQNAEPLGRNVMTILVTVGQGRWNERPHPPVFLGVLIVMTRAHFVFTSQLLLALGQILDLEIDGGPGNRTDEFLPERWPG
jgi:hypothetical protein